MTKKTQKKLRKALLLISCAALLVCITVGVTVAYLTDDATVTNTFSVGNVTITMDESKVDEYGVVVPSATPVAGNEYKLIPGHTYTKDPIIHVGATSEDCYLFVKLDNGLGNEENTIVTQMTSDTYGWTAVAEGSNVYYYKEAVSKGANVPVFGTFTFDNDADPETYEDAEIVVTAYAVQKDGFKTETNTHAQAAVAAWNATFGAPTNP